MRTAAAGPGATSVTMSGLTNGLAYTFIVTASNALGSSVGSGAASPHPAGPPGPPRIGYRHPRRGAAIVRWSPPVSNGGAPIRAYVVRTYRGTTLVEQTNVSAATTRVLINGLTNGLGYTFSVTALNGVGWGWAVIHGPGRPTALTRIFRVSARRAGYRNEPVLPMMQS